MPRRRDDEAQWRTRAGNGGWAVIEGAGEHIVVRVEPDETSRYRVRELHLLDTGEPITAERLRAVRVAALEQLLSLPQERAEIEKRFARSPSVDVEAAAAKFGEIAPARTVYGASSLKVEVGISSSGSVTPGLSAPGQRGYPDSFYASVAEAYRRALRRDAPGHSKPIAVIAAEAGVPRTTAARWVKEARKRGKLPKATPGKVSP